MGDSMTAAALSEALLLAQAVEACRERGRVLLVGLGSYAHRSTEDRLDVRGYPDLTALLRDLGVEPVEWPSAEEAREAEQLTPRGIFTLAEDMSHLSKVVTLSRLRDLARDQPAKALALLFGEEGS